jgi:hypothetical protein
MWRQYQTTKKSQAGKDLKRTACWSNAAEDATDKNVEEFRDQIHKQSQFKRLREEMRVEWRATADKRVHGTKQLLLDRRLHPGCGGMSLCKPIDEVQKMTESRALKDKQQRIHGLMHGCAKRRNEVKHLQDVLRSEEVFQPVSPRRASAVALLMLS